MGIQFALNIVNVYVRRAIGAAAALIIEIQ